MEIPAAAGAGAGAATPRPAGALEAALGQGLRPRYELYRRQQVRELLSLLPPDALRPLYRSASAALEEPGGTVDDPLALLSAFVERLLPLPPFEVWRADVLAHPDAHLDEPWMEGARPDRRSPLVAAARSAVLRGEGWRIELRVWDDGDAWRGHLHFEPARGGRGYRTGDVFMESRLDAVRERFDAFDGATLEAFLRSVLP